ncbi:MULTISPECIES: hypothetical protein [unclassified Paraburkholderia]|uniref:hypothetical protein n=1 Tax=unclassified Paraburkholderia TaxID=2615204 RepID=UPI001608AC87|nr:MULTISPECIES: hypothetical protein [unclassified Paraburkholderia]MBB5442484.1 hypothetical protein [Paraburkholderia sp. WSM4177]MBB5482708.1 hypothetical protein [Paraburkholderia sp. WSM4180]
MRVSSLGFFISDLPGGAIGLNEPEWPDRKFRMRMSEYPCSYINKAVLKFPRQDRKKSQIVSVKISVFFMHFARQLLPQYGLTEDSGQPIRALSHRSFRFANSSGREARAPLVLSFLRIIKRKKCLLIFFR